ncbi:MAG TPA: hypothetical protein VEG66_03985 [Thermoplasmata archaeon]|jgi:hypothetical protein|nr:hypothetical protein [Thermoplasmata archaeon]
MSGVVRGRPFLRGGWTAFFGWILVFLGVLGGSVAVVESNWFMAWVTSTQLSLPQYAVLQEWTLLFFSAITAGVGVMLIGFAVDERRREEKLDLDPLDYPPFRRPTWQKMVPVAVALAIVVAVPGFYTIPVSQSFQEGFPVVECSATFVPFLVSLPAGAILTYEWHSSDGAPVAEMYAPNVPANGVQGISPELFYDSSFGYGSVRSNGTPFGFWACDPGAIAAGLQIDLTGAYYIFH